MDKEPFIVTVLGSVEEFRGALAAKLPEAKVLRELPGNKAVVLLSADQVGRLSAIPAVSAVVPDVLRQKLRPGRTGDA